MKKSIFIFGIIISTIVSCTQTGKQSDEGKHETKSPIVLLTDSIAQDSTNIFLLNRRAQYFIQQHELSKALIDLNKALLINSKEPKLFVTLAEIYFQLGKIENCSSSLLKAIDLNPLELEAFNKLTQLNLLNKRFDVAMSYNEKALEIDKFNPKTLYIRGMLFLAKEDTVSAMKNFQLSHDNKPDFYDALIQIGAILNKQHSPLAADYLKKAVFYFPESSQARYELALYFQENERPNEAMAQYDTMMMFFPVNKYVLYNIGYLYLVFGQQFDSAIYYF